MLTALIVAARIAANPLSNVFQKQLTQRGADPLFIVGVTHALLTLACAPLLLDPVTLDAPAAFWANIIVASALAVAGNVLLVHALKAGDLSVLGPINAYKALLSVVLGVVLLGEVPTLSGVVGMLLILAGSYFVVDTVATRSDRSPFGQFVRSAGVQFRFAALALSATEAVFLKRALLESTPSTTFVMWSVLGLPIAAIISAVLLRGRVRAELMVVSRHPRTYVWLALATGIMQLTTIVTFGRLQVGYSLALFQLSALISVFLGYRYFQERDIRKRLLGAAVMVAGAAMIVTFGKP